MLGVSSSFLILILVIAALAGGAFYLVRRQDVRATGKAAVKATGQATEGERGAGRISLLTEAVAYVGAILILAAGIAMVGQRWDRTGAWGHVAVFAGAAAFFLLVGVVVRQVREPAIQRLAGVVWFLSAVSVGWAVGLVSSEVYGNSGQVTLLAVGIGVTLYAAALWLVRRQALQDLALFAGLAVAICGVIAVVGSGPVLWLAVALGLWAFGLAWAWLGWRRHVEPAQMTVGLGVGLALVAPIVGVGPYGWVFAIAIATAAATMAASVPLRSAPLLGAGTLALFAYVTAAVVRYFGESLGVPGALAITGLLIVGLAVVTARMMRAARPAEPGQRSGGQPSAGEPSSLTRPPEPKEPGSDRHSDRDLPKAS